MHTLLPRAESTTQFGLTKHSQTERATLASVESLSEGNKLVHILLPCSPGLEVTMDKKPRYPPGNHLASHL